MRRRGDGSPGARSNARTACPPRAGLRASVPSHDGVFNAQRVALPLASLGAGRPAALAAALEDRLHEPYRLRLFPWMPEVVRAARAAGALGCVLSGAGPSLLAVVAGDDTPVAAAMEAALRRAGMAGAARRFDVDTAGAAEPRARVEHARGSHCP